MTARLFPKLRDEIKRQTMDHLVNYEHAILKLVVGMERRGVRIDVEYAEKLIESMTAEEQHNIGVVKSFGVKNHNATRDVAEGLQRLGITLVETTESGALKVDKTILSAIGDDKNAGNAGMLARAVMAAKNSAKWRDSYIVASLASMDANGRVHPKINSLQARTGNVDKQSTVATVAFGRRYDPPYVLG